MIELAIIITAGFLLFMAHIFVIEKYHKQKDENKRVIKRDLLGSPVHMLFTIGDSFVFVGIFYYFKDLPREQYPVVFSVGILIIIIGVISYRLLQIWFEKIPAKRERKF